MWKLIGRPESHKVSRPLVEEFALMEAAPRDRGLQERRMSIYGKFLRRGQFRTFSWASAYCKETGKLYRVNGKHTSTLLHRVIDVLEPGEVALNELHVVVERYQCETLEDVAKLYATFDSPLSNRTASDINKSFAASIPELGEVPSSILNLTVSGMCWHKLQDSYSNHLQPDERPEILKENPSFCLWLWEVMTSSPNRHASLYRMPVCAAMYHTWLEDKDKATTFWTMVRDETGTTPETPDRKLAKFLYKHGTTHGRKTQKRLTNQPFYNKCIREWRVWKKSNK